MHKTNRLLSSALSTVTLVVLGVLLSSSAFAVQGLRAQFYKDHATDWGAFGSDTDYPAPYWSGIIPNVDAVYANSVDQYFSMRAQGYLYVSPAMAGNIEFKTVTDDGARLYIDGNMVINFWRLQSHQTIGSPTDECTHTATVNLTAGYHAIKFEYFEWEGGQNDPDPCKLYWNGQIIPATSLYTEAPPVSGLAITNVSVAPSPFNPTNGQSCNISYTLNLSANVTIEILALSGATVRTVINAAARPMGASSDAWNGRDSGGQIVADGAWAYRITAQRNGDTVVYDAGCPPLFTVTNIAATNTHPGQRSTITYTLPSTSRVRLRVGMPVGPAVSTPVDWSIRSAGAQTDYWDGCINGGSPAPIQEYEVAIWAYPVPVNCIITTGAG